MAGARDGIYLSGWEYNRLLGADPIVRRNSALPAEILWNGSAPLWLFRNVFCTQEAIDNEWRAYELLGWSTGCIFTELCNREIITPLDWMSLGSATQRLMRKKRTELLTGAVNEDYIRQLISAGATGELDVLKNALLTPIADAKNCVLAVTPNSLSNWIAPSRAHAPRATETVLREIASRIPAGLALCSPPGTGLTKELRVQRQIETDHQTPMIPELLAGEGRFSGPAGYEAYLRQLMPFKAAFAPINEQLLNEWRHNQDKLFQLRDVAEQHLWPFLHGEWIPALECGEASAEQFVELLDRALKHHRIASLLGQRGRMAMVVSSAGVGGIASALQAIVGSSLTALPTAAGSGIAAGVAAGTGVVMSMLADNAAKKSDQRRSDTDQLTMFYQQAEKLAS